jgi:two-component system phosphate regulon response regulator PhoB
MATHRFSTPGIELDLETHRVKRNGLDIHLGFDRIQAAAAPDAQSRAGLRARGPDRQRLAANIHVEPRTVNVHIGRLRKALSSERIAGSDPNGAIGGICPGRHSASENPGDSDGIST